MERDGGMKGEGMVGDGRRKKAIEPSKGRYVERGRRRAKGGGQEGRGKERGEGVAAGEGRSIVSARGGQRGDR